MSTLDAQLLAAHARDDKHSLIALYTQAADSATTPVASAFYLTHAYVFALETGDARAAKLHARLKDMGRA